MVSSIKSITSENSEGQGAPPKGILKDIINYHAPSIFTLTANQQAFIVFKWNRLKADFMSSFWIQIRVFLYFLRNANIMYYSGENKAEHTWFLFVPFHSRIYGFARNFPWKWKIVCYRVFYLKISWFRDSYLSCYSHSV